MKKIHTRVKPINVLDLYRGMIIQKAEYEVICKEHNVDFIPGAIVFDKIVVTVTDAKDAT